LREIKRKKPRKMNNFIRAERRWKIDKNFHVLHMWKALEIIENVDYFFHFSFCHNHQNQSKIYTLIDRWRPGFSLIKFTWIFLVGFGWLRFLLGILHDAQILMENSKNLSNWIPRISRKIRKALKTNSQKMSVGDKWEKYENATKKSQNKSNFIITPHQIFFPSNHKQY
jgi:hypothetical protein